MKIQKLENLLSKAEELNVIEFLQEVISFVKDISPILENMNVSLRENLKKMPDATKKLTKVTEATEFATTEIMNLIDGLFSKVDKITKNNKTQPSSESTANSQELLDTMNDDLNNIMMALQVQDITAQQIAAVNQLLSVIQTRLAKILTNFDTAAISELLSDGDENKNVVTMHRKIAFDPNAIDAYMNQHSRQDQIDKFMEMANNGTLDQKKLSSDDIDALFAGADPDMVDIDEMAKREVSDKTPDLSAIDPFSQNDIDSLFSNTGSTATENSGEDFSNDDIDALFNNSTATEDSGEDISNDDIDALFANG